jgi:hypothetical protein
VLAEARHLRQQEPRRRLLRSASSAMPRDATCQSACSADCDIARRDTGVQRAFQACSNVYTGMPRVKRTLNDVHSAPTLASAQNLAPHACADMMRRLEHGCVGVRGCARTHARVGHAGNWPFLCGDGRRLYATTRLRHSATKFLPGVAGLAAAGLFSVLGWCLSAIFAKVDTEVSRAHNGPNGPISVREWIGTA